VVNKADRAGANQTVRDLRSDTEASILKLLAAPSEGIPELVEAIETRHRADIGNGVSHLPARPCCR
jgi:LAO/AO transport system kinase